MKFFILSILSIVSFSYSFGQAFYKSSNKKEFENLMSNGLVYFPSSNNIIDSAYLAALKNNWDVTPVEVYDGSDNSVQNKTTIIEANVHSGPVFSLVPVNSLMNEDSTFSKYLTIGYFYRDGFTQSDSKEKKYDFIDLSIAALNDVVSVVNEQQISSLGAGLYKKIHKAILPKSKVLKEKTLLIIGWTKNFVSLSALEKHGIKYKLLTEAEYFDLDDDEKSTCCLMYFANRTFVDIAIFDLENNDLIYTKHFTSDKRKFNGSDIKRMVGAWN